MQAILDFITGPLNTFAWMYCLLPCVFLGGLYFTIRNKGIQFTKFGYAMKNTIGKVFEKQEAGEGAVTPFQAVTTAWLLPSAPATSSAPARQLPWAVTALSSGCGWPPC